MPYNSPMKKKGSSCMQMKDYKGKPSGLMMEGSTAHMESMGQEKKNLMKDMPVDDKASAMEMSPYKMDHGSPAKMSPYKLTEKEKEIPTEELGEVIVTGEASKVGAYGKELDKIFSDIQGVLDAGGYSSSGAQAQAGLGYGTKASQEFGRLQEMREKEGVIPTLRYIKRRQRDN